MASRAANKKHKAFNSKRKTSDCVHAIRSAVSTVFSCGNFYKCSFDLPHGAGEQLSITGFSLAFGNGGGFLNSAVPELSNVMKSFPAMHGYSDPTIEKLARRKHFIIQCGACDVHLAVLGALSEIIKSGALKIIVVADSSDERSSIFNSLNMMRAELNGASISLFDADKLKKAENTVYGFLTSEYPEILVMGQASFTREYNFLRRFDLASHISKSRPVVITVSDTTVSARSITKSAGIFDPCAVVSVINEVKRLRDAIIFRPADLETLKTNGKNNSNELVQLSL